MHLEEWTQLLLSTSAIFAFCLQIKWQTSAAFGNTSFHFLNASGYWRFHYLQQRLFSHYACIWSWEDVSADFGSANYHLTSQHNDVHNITVIFSHKKKEKNIWIPKWKCPIDISFSNPIRGLTSTFLCPETQLHFCSPAISKKCYFCLEIKGVDWTK